MKLGVLIAMLLLAAPLPILAQGTLAQDYDTSKRVTFAGTVDAMIMPPGELPVCFNLREALPTGLSPATEAALKAGRLAQGVEVKLADGQTLPFGPPK